MSLSINSRVVVDSNVLISAIVWGGKPGKVLELWHKNEFILYTSPYILAELANFLTEIGSGIKERGIIINRFKSKAAKIIPPKKVTVCRDPKDNQILDLCLASKADYLISGDNDLLILKSFKKTKIITPQKFLLNR